MPKQPVLQAQVTADGEGHHHAAGESTGGGRRRNGDLGGLPAGAGRSGEVINDVVAEHQRGCGCGRAGSVEDTGGSEVRTS